MNVKMIQRYSTLMPQVLDRLAAEVYANRGKKNPYKRPRPNLKGRDNCFSGLPQTKEEVLAALGERHVDQNKRLKRLGTILEVLKCCTHRSEVTVLSLACITIGKICRYKKPEKEGLKLRQLMQKVGLIELVDDYHSWSRKKEYRCAQLFAYSKKVQDILLVLIKERGINVPPPTFASLREEGRADEIEMVARTDATNAKWTASLFNFDFGKGYNIPGLNDDSVTALLKAKHPSFDFVVGTYASCNDLLKQFNGTNPIIQYKFEPSATYRNGYFTRCGIRAYAPVCSFSKEPEYWGDMTRFDFLKEQLGWKPHVENCIVDGKKVGVECFYQYDVPASIYCIQRGLNKGVWTDDSVDLYSLIYGERFDLNNPADVKRRKVKKELLQRAEFIDDVLVAGRCVKYYAPNFFKDFGSENKRVADYYEGTTLRNNVVFTADEIMAYLKERIENVCGPCMGSKVFYYESAIYGMAFKKLLEDGINCIQVYDCFISQDPRIITEAPKAIREAFNEFYEKWYKTEPDSISKESVDAILGKMVSAKIISSC